MKLETLFILMYIYDPRKQEEEYLEMVKITTLVEEYNSLISHQLENRTVTINLLNNFFFKDSYFENSGKQLEIYAKHASLGAKGVCNMDQVDFLTTVNSLQINLGKLGENSEIVFSTQIENRRGLIITPTRLSAINQLDSPCTPKRVPIVHMLFNTPNRNILERVNSEEPAPVSEPDSDQVPEPAVVAEPESVSEVENTEVEYTPEIQLLGEKIRDKTDQDKKKDLVEKIIQIKRKMFILLLCSENM